MPSGQARLTQHPPPSLISHMWTSPRGTVDSTLRGGRVDLGAMYCLGVVMSVLLGVPKKCSHQPPSYQAGRWEEVPVMLSLGAVSAMHGKEQPTRLCLLFTFAAPGISHIDPSQ